MQTHGVIVHVYVGCVKAVVLPDQYILYYTSLSNSCASFFVFSSQGSQKGEKEKERFVNSGNESFFFLTQKNFRVLSQA